MLRTLTFVVFALFATTAFAAPAAKDSKKEFPNPITQIKEAHRAKLTKLKAAHFTRIDSIGLETLLFRKAIQPADAPVLEMVALTLPDAS